MVDIAFEFLVCVHGVFAAVVGKEGGGPFGQLPTNLDPD